ncbi:putative non-specific serine/threonine protein kinase [Rosa chinensis]|uniref:Putative non-specific serine/threonine protein kinase n=1 Tax=Rosa chinensis TaxID=74649 RepID=A0A2P6QBE2_ROSCH|nr:putative non-specific serine/threonine protein kinase [Rosa chinensis]
MPLPDCSWIWSSYDGGKHEFFDVKDKHHEEISLWNLKRFHLRELQIATNNFNSKYLLRKGGFGHVYKGTICDGTVVAVKRLKDGSALGGEIQFQT